MRNLRTTILTLSMISLLTACQKMSEETELTPCIVFDDEIQTLIQVEEGSLEPLSIGFTSKFKTEDLVLEVEAENDWCTAEFKDGNTICLLPTETGLTKRQMAKITVNGKEGLRLKEGKTTYRPEEVSIFAVRKAMGIKIKPALKFVPDQNEFTIPAGCDEPLVLHYESPFRHEELDIRILEGEDWCTAEFTQEKTITVTPIPGLTDNTYCTKFQVEGKTLSKAAELLVPDPVQFTVKRQKVVITTQPVFGIHGYNNLINVGSGWVKDFLIPTDYFFPLESITVTKEAGNNWCEAILTEEGIKIVPSDKRLDEDLETTFTFSSNAESENHGVIYQAEDVKITIIRPAN